MNLSISWAKPVMFLSHGANPSAITLTMGADAAVITARPTITTLRMRSNEERMWRYASIAREVHRTQPRSPSEVRT